MRFLTGVTITGADDKVSPLKLRDLSREFPFVEWGILVSAKKVGVPRYPSREWCTALKEMPMRKSAHICGTWARSGDVSKLAAVMGCDRLQLNGFKKYREHMVTAVADAGRPEHIFQVGKPPDVRSALEAARGINQVGGKASVLWDPSGGKGIYAKPEPLFGGPVLVGYAGGISPRNVREVLESLAPGGPCWIDMESGVRTDDELDLVKVRSVLEQARPYVLEEYCG